MANAAVIWNPLTLSDKKKDNRLLVFTNSSKQNLALRQWSFEDWGNEYSEKPESAAGNVKIGGAFAAIQSRGWVRVYGLVSQKDKSEKETVYISLLSPVIQSLSAKTIYNRLSASGDGETKGWLYYLNSDPPALYERPIEGTNSNKIGSGVSLLNKATALTDVASCYTPNLNHRWVFYQNNDAKVDGFNITESKYPPITADAVPGSPLAATSFDHNGIDILVVYWVHQGDNYLGRSHSTNGGQTWSDKVLSDAGTLSLETLSVSKNDTLQVNAVASSAEDGGSIQIYPDEWKKIVV